MTLLILVRVAKSLSSPPPPPHTETPAFKRWFAGSRVVHADGKPKVFYHSTTAPVDFSSFKTRSCDIGSHFGTLAQAEDRTAYMASRPGGTPHGERVYPVHLSIKNPLRLKDAGSWDADNLGVHMEHSGHFTKPEIQGAMRSAKNLRGQTTALKNLIQSKGFDGVVYRNTGEVPGMAAHMQKLYAAKTDAERSELFKQKQAMEDSATEDSYIAFHPHQIKSATGNSGAFDPKSPDIRKGVGRFRKARNASL